ncbi:MAG: glycerophosphodiester phosphodiesterase [Actinomycetes bacterium]
MDVEFLVRGRRPDAPTVMAHRGGAALGPENSVDTLRAAAAARAHSVEVDLVQTGDGELVLLHDQVVGPVHDQHFVRDLTLEQLAAALGERPSTHRELLDSCAALGLGLYAEVKAASREALDRLVADVVDLGLVAQVCVASFQSDVVAHVAQHGAVATSWLFWDPGVDPLAMALDTGCSFVHPCFDLFPELVELMEGRWMERLWAAGRGVVSWNTTDPALMVRMAEVGLAAICTDDPRVVPDGLSQPATGG